MKYEFHESETRRKPSGVWEGKTVRKKGILGVFLALILCFGAVAPACAVNRGVGQYAIIMTGDLRPGDTGDAVASLQRRLAVLGYLRGEPTGTYDDATKRAVAQFETYLSAQQDPIIGIDGVAPAAPEGAVVVDGEADTNVLETLYSLTDGCFQEQLRLGDDNSEVLRLQNRLANLGYLSGKLDTIFGSQTRIAVRAFQFANSLKEDGIATQETQELLYSDEAVPAAYPALASGDSGAKVMRLQELLMRLGFLEATQADGTYGNATKIAVSNLQTYLRNKGVRLGANRNTAQETEMGMVFPVGEDMTVETVSVTPAPSDVSSPNMSGEAIAYNGEDPYDISANGVMDSLLMEYISTTDTVSMLGTMKKDDWNDEVKRVQRRLFSLEYLFSTADGVYGTGTEAAVLEFQRRNHLTETGRCDQATLALMFSNEARRGMRTYRIIVSVDEQKVYVYTYDANDQYTKLVRTMTCSTGTRSTPTPLGTFTNTGRGARWHQFTKWGSWAQYAFYINGDILFHSVLYNTNNENSLIRSSVSALGRRASHGCVRLSVEDAKWIWTNCEQHTTVIVR